VGNAASEDLFGESGWYETMTLPRELWKDRTGISPVMGVILMVAITVILAAVAGAVVLGVGTTQGPPEASLEISSVNKTYEYTASTTRTANFSEIRIKHAGGDPIDMSRVNVVIDGTDGVAYNASVDPGFPIFSQSFENQKFTAGNETVISFMYKNEYNGGELNFDSTTGGVEILDPSSDDPVLNPDLERPSEGSKIQLIWSRGDSDES